MVLLTASLCSRAGPGPAMARPSSLPPPLPLHQVSGAGLVSPNSLLWAPEASLPPPSCLGGPSCCHCSVPSNGQGGLRAGERVQAGCTCAGASTCPGCPTPVPRPSPDPAILRPAARPLACKAPQLGERAQGPPGHRWRRLSLVPLTSQWLLAAAASPVERRESPGKTWGHLSPCASPP